MTTLHAVTFHLTADEIAEVSAFVDALIGTTEPEPEEPGMTPDQADELFRSIDTRAYSLVELGAMIRPAEASSDAKKSAARRTLARVRKVPG